MTKMQLCHNFETYAGKRLKLIQLSTALHLVKVSEAWLVQGSFAVKGKMPFLLQ